MVLLNSFFGSKRKFEAPHDGWKPVALVTGAGRGIGKATVLSLAAQGWRVWAGVLTDKELQEMSSVHGNITAVKLDVTSAESVREAAAQVEKAVGGDGLQGLVNNAGIGIGAAVEFLPVDKFQAVMDVNVTGALRCVQAFLPLLRAGDNRGRVINISSLLGTFGLPTLSPYCASKHALEGLSHCLRQELAPGGVAVIIVKPGTVATQIWEDAGAASEALKTREAEERYGTFHTQMDKFATDASRNGMHPRQVAEAVVEALTARRPRIRYLVGPDAKVLYSFWSVLPLGAFYSLIQFIGSRV